MSEREAHHEAWEELQAAKKDMDVAYHATIRKAREEAIEKAIAAYAEAWEKAYAAYKEAVENVQQPQPKETNNV